LQKKTRFVFTAHKDINLLKVALQKNPWQLGVDKWTEISEELKIQHEYNLSGRACRERIKILLSKLEKEEMQTL